MLVSGSRICLCLVNYCLLPVFLSLCSFLSFLFHSAQCHVAYSCPSLRQNTPNHSKNPAPLYMASRLRFSYRRSSKARHLKVSVKVICDEPHDIHSEKSGASRFLFS